ncbi:hypothetical protein [Salmonella enterica]|uniref:hypothetical protein n=1 Tax=Salmonella enterica TaxID=28901 RepID=UPI000BE97658|nr:hypothetical protein [Salmonella enterica]PDW07840.1 hypothetical protein CJS38_10785 [Salmonella enterica subsp. enterica serovar Schwarzengrund]
MGSCAAPSAKGDDKFITTDYLQQCPLTNETGFNVTVRMLRTNSSLCGISSPLCDFYSALATRFIGS